ncbi:Pao retrotransposon peptidase family protein [Dirofilaria immitis]|nr:Pao retrotransposon peptidase family protein [Dirofilaria immitis]
MVPRAGATSNNIIASIQPAKTWLVFLLQEIDSIKLNPSDSNAPIEQQEGDQGLFKLLHEGKEAIITLTMHKDEVEQKKVQEEVNLSNLTVNLPQLSLHILNGDPRQWGQFWSSFNAAVHSQTIPEIQELNYLYSCLKGNALQVISGYKIALENYEIIRRLLKEKYGDSSTISAILYNELQSIKRNEKDWMETIEKIESVLRQLEVLGESVEHSSIETLIESKLPLWILNKSSSIYADSKYTIKTTQKQRYSSRETSAFYTIQSNQNSSQPMANKRRPSTFCA